MLKINIPMIKDNRLFLNYKNVTLFFYFIKKLNNFNLYRLYLNFLKFSFLNKRKSTTPVIIEKFYNYVPVILKKAFWNIEVGYYYAQELLSNYLLKFNDNVTEFNLKLNIKKNKTLISYNSLFISLFITFFNKKINILNKKNKIKNVLKKNLNFIVNIKNSCFSYKLNSFFFNKFSDISTIYFIEFLKFFFYREIEDIKYKPIYDFSDSILNFISFPKYVLNLYYNNLKYLNQNNYNYFYLPKKENLYSQGILNFYKSHNVRNNFIKKKYFIKKPLIKLYNNIIINKKKKIVNDSKYSVLYSDYRDILYFNIKYNFLFFFKNVTPYFKKKIRKYRNMIFTGDWDTIRFCKQKINKKGFFRNKKFWRFFKKKRKNRKKMFIFFLGLFPIAKYFKILKTRPFIVNLDYKVLKNNKKINYLYFINNNNNKTKLIKKNTISYYLFFNNKNFNKKIIKINNFIWIDSILSNTNYNITKLKPNRTSKKFEFINKNASSMVTHKFVNNVGITYKKFKNEIRNMLKNSGFRRARLHIEKTMSRYSFIKRLFQTGKMFLNFHNSYSQYNVRYLFFRITELRKKKTNFFKNKNNIYNKNSKNIWSFFNKKVFNRYFDIFIKNKKYNNYFKFNVNDFFKNVISKKYKYWQSFFISWNWTFLCLNDFTKLIGKYDYHEFRSRLMYQRNRFYHTKKFFLKTRKTFKDYRFRREKWNSSWKYSYNYNLVNKDLNYIVYKNASNVYSNKDWFNKKKNKYKRVRVQLIKNQHAKYLRQERVRVKTFFRLNYRFQHRLTNWLYRFKLYHGIKLFYDWNCNLVNTLNNSNFIPGYRNALFVLINKLCYLNGYTVMSQNLPIFRGDIISLKISWYVYLYIIGILKIHKCDLLSSKYIQKNKLSRNKKKLKKAIFNFITDVPYYVEIDYMTLSCVILFEPDVNYLIKKNIYNLTYAPILSLFNLNWKYVVYIWNQIYLIYGILIIII